MASVVDIIIAFVVEGLESKQVIMNGHLQVSSLLVRGVIMIQGETGKAVRGVASKGVQ